MVGRRVRVCRGCECEAAALGGWEGRRAGKEAWCFILGDGLRVRVYSTIEMGCEVSSGRDHEDDSPMGCHYMGLIIRAHLLTFMRHGPKSENVLSYGPTAHTPV